MTRPGQARAGEQPGVRDALHCARLCHAEDQVPLLLSLRSDWFVRVHLVHVHVHVAEKPLWMHVHVDTYTCVIMHINSGHTVLSL